MNSNGAGNAQESKLVWLFAINCSVFLSYFFCLSLFPSALFYLPSPVSAFSILTAFTVYKSNIKVGSLTAVLSLAVFFLYLTEIRVFHTFPADAWNRFGSLSLTLPLIILIMGHLRSKTERLTTAHASSKSLNEIASAMPHMLWVASVGGDVTYFNESWFSYTGLSESESLGSAWLQAVHPHDVDQCAETWSESLAAGSMYEIEYRLKGADNNYRWNLGRAVPVRDQSSLITKWIGTCTDINERKIKDQLVENYQKRTESILENVSALIWAFDLGGKITFSTGGFSNPLLDFVKLPGSEIVAKLMRGAVELDRCYEQTKKGLSSEITVQYAEGWIDIIVSPTLDKNMKVMGGVAVATDVTDRHDSEKSKKQLREMEQNSILLILRERELEASTARLQTLINSSPVAILTLNSAGHVDLWNPACETVFGWTANEAIGMPLPFIQDSERAESYAIINRIMTGKESVHFASNRLKKDGKEIKTSTSAMPIFDSEGKVSGLIAVIIDDTEAYLARKEILESNAALKLATRTKSDFLATISHEIRTPINGVIGMTGLLLDTELSSEQRKFTETIETSASILLGLVNDVLDFSKVEANQLKLENIEFDLENLLSDIERIISVSAAKKNLPLTKDIEKELLLNSFFGDPTRIGQVLANLISNAVKFTQQGNVSISAIIESQDLSSAVVRFEISDTGIGLSNDEIKRIFTPFSQADASTTRKFGGTGLGLSICKHLIELMGGKIGVRSEVAVGSVFWFTVPLLKRPKLKSVENLVSQLTSDFTGARILLAEDNSVNQLIAIKILTKHGFRVDPVGNGLEALKALQLAPYDLVLMDCQMPELDGYDATSSIRNAAGSSFQNIPVIALTANAMDGDRKRCENAGMSDYVTKPFKAQDLLSAIERNLRAHRSKTA